MAGEFNNIIQNIINIKEKIENEISNVNNLYEKVISDLTKSFQKKHEKLIKEEEGIKEKLENEVTKVKKELENLLSKSNNEIKLNERINLGIKKMEKEDKNMFKILSYISKINKNKKEMEKLSLQSMKSMKFYFNENENNIIYEEFYFNKDINIEFSNISSKSLSISLNLKNKIYDYNQFKYKVEMRKENSDEEFKNMYEGNKQKFLINNLIPFTSYEFRISSIYKQNNNPYSEIIKVRTCFDSNILNDITKKEE